MTKGNVEEAIRVIAGMQANKTIQKVEEQDEHLLPGIPDELTLNNITSRLPWRAVHGLPLLNRCWRRAVQIRQIYEGRVSSRSTETLLVISYQAGPMKVFALYSYRDKCRYFLPSIPQIAEGIPSSSQWISLDGKIYILGGMNDKKSDCSSSDVYVLDLVGQRQWKQCASMQKRRRDFGCGVISGKIYVFGGFTSNYEIIRESEQYDPKVDAWSVIKPLKYLPWRQQVAAVGDELFVYAGGFYYSFAAWKLRRLTDRNREHTALFLEVYNPINDNWRLVEPFIRKRKLQETLFVAKGKFYSMTRSFIHVYDVDRKLWKRLHSFRLEAPLLIGAVKIDLNDVLAVNNELLAIVDWATECQDVRKSCLLQSRGFGTANKRI